MLPEWIPEAIKLYNEGMSYSMLAEKYGMNRKTISNYLRAAGNKSNTKWMPKVIPIEKFRKYDYTYAEQLYDKVDTEEKAYWLGFLYADGQVSYCKNTIELSLKESDLGAIEAFRSFWHLDDKKIQKKVKKNGNKEYIGYRFTLDSAKIKNDLIRLGCPDRKTFCIKFPTKEQVPESLIHHFIRGYFDGDGCVTHGSTSKITIEMLGTEDFLEGYREWTGLHHNKICGFNHSVIRRLAYGGPYAVYILDKIYKNASIFLQRKYDKYMELRRLEVKSLELQDNECGIKLEGLVKSNQSPKARHRRVRRNA